MICKSTIILIASLFVASATCDWNAGKLNPKSVSHAKSWTVPGQAVPSQAPEQAVSTAKEITTQIPAQANNTATATPSQAPAQSITSSHAPSTASQPHQSMPWQPPPTQSPNPKHDKIHEGNSGDEIGNDEEDFGLDAMGLEGDGLLMRNHRFWKLIREILRDNRG